MALIKCPECGREVSDASADCIHCGYPLNDRHNTREKTDFGGLQFPIKAVIAIVCVVALLAVILLTNNSDHDSEIDNGDIYVPTESTPTTPPTQPSIPRENPKVKVGDYVTFGTYEQDNNISNGQEAIEWQVLEVRPDRVLLISRYALSCQPYNTVYTNTTWESSSLRKWLNGSFYNDAFSSQDKSMIPTVVVPAHKHPSYESDPGNATQDKVFVLSRVELATYFSDDIGAKCEPTPYAQSLGADVLSTMGTCCWWLRTPSLSQRDASLVAYYGTIQDGASIHVTFDKVGVRPAIWVEMKNGEITTSNVKLNSVSESAGCGDYHIGDLISFGAYEQDNVVTNGPEDVEWLILEIDGNNAYVVSKYALECMPFNSTLQFVSWRDCSLRAWLNYNFYNMVFSPDEQAAIHTTKVSADKTLGYVPTAGDYTQDKVFLLSGKEVGHYFGTKEKSLCDATPYVLAKGVTAGLYVGSRPNSCRWWLWFEPRAGVDVYGAIVECNGEVHVSMAANDLQNIAVRPAMWIDLSKIK